MKLLCPFVLAETHATFGACGTVLWVNPAHVLGVHDQSYGRTKQAVIHFISGQTVEVKGTADSVTDSLLNLADATPVPGGAS